MNAKKKRLLISNIFLFLSLILLISFNKDYLRPAFQENHFLNQLTNCFPNFYAAFVISLAFVNAAIIRNFKFDRLIVYFVSITGFLILAFEEFVPLWGASEVFDKLDILSSGIGCLISIIIFEIVRFKKKKKENSLNKDESAQNTMVH